MSNPHPEPSLAERIERTAPLLPVALGLIAGVLVDRFFPPPVIAYAAVAAVAALAVLLPIMRRRGLIVILSTVSIVAGGLLHYRQMWHVPADGIERYLGGGDESFARVRGRVVSPPRIVAPPEHLFSPWTFGSYRTAFLLGVDEVETTAGFAPASGLVRVSVNEAVLDLHQGERVEMFGELYRPRPPRNPGGFDWALHARREGVRAGFICAHGAGVVRLAALPRVGVDRALEWLRNRARGLLTDDLAADSPEEAGLLEAMIIGQRAQLDQRLNDVFIRAGCMHFIAVSGVNVAIVLALAAGVARLLPVRRSTRTWIMIAAVVAYTLITDPRPSILRAAVIGLIYCLARLLGRERASLNWISATVIVLALYDPAMIFDVGYQLSTLAVLGVVYLAPALDKALRALHQTAAAVARGERLSPANRRLIEAVRRDQHVRDPWPTRTARRAGRALATAVVISLGAWLATAPIALVHFGRLQPWGAVNTVILMPIVTGVMALGVAKFLASAALPTLGSLIGFPLQWLNGLMITVVEWLSHAPGASIDRPGAPWWVIAACYAPLLALVLRFPPGSQSVEDEDAGIPVGLGASAIPLPRPVLRPVRGRWLGLAVVGLVVSVTAWHWPAAPPERLRLTFLAVGRGSSTIIELPDGRTILYDAGAFGPYDPGRGTILPFLRERGIRRVDRIWISHPNLDHFSGTPTLIDTIACGPVVLNEYFAPGADGGSPAEALLTHLKKRNHRIEPAMPAARSWESGGVTFDQLWPPPGLDEGVDANDTSTVLRLTYAGRSVLLTGDIEEQAQSAMMERGDLHADVLALPHHGAVVGTTRRFVSAVGAAVLIRSDHQPMRETPAGLASIAGDTPLYNTADCGAIEVEIDDAGVRVRTMQACEGE